MLLRLRRPSGDEINRFLATQADMPFSYPEVGATRDARLPSGCDRAGASCAMGHGDAVFERGQKAVASWRMFDIPWVELYGGEQTPAPGVCVAVVGHVLGLWSVNVARVVYVIDEPDRYGFAYGSLPAHAERGEELFAVARAPDGTVTYEIRVFFRPQLWWSRLGKPIVTTQQSRFREASCDAMQRAVGPL